MIIVKLTWIQQKGTDLEKEECDDGRRVRSNVLGKVKRMQKRWCVEEGREEGEDGEDVDLRDQEKLGWVEEVPMSKFVC